MRILIKLLLITILFLPSKYGYAQLTPSFLDRMDEKIPGEANQQFQFLAFFYTHGVGTNIYPENDFLRGQVIGRLFGQNTTQTSDSLQAFYFEQRILPFFIYSPRIFNGRATLRASFEIDWTWGDVAYGAGPNQGSAPSADQVNLQTQNIELELIPAKGWAINLGLQRMYDTPFNPYRTFFEQLTNTAYRLNYWGTDGVGVSVRYDRDYERFKAGYYQLYENNIEQLDDVSFMEFTYHRNLNYRWDLGVSAHYVRDRANGEGGPSILGQGLNALLNTYNGTYRFPYGGQRYRADVGWLGTYWSFNRQYVLHRWFMTGYANWNFGMVDLENEAGAFEPTTSLSGLGANLRVGYRYGQTIADAFTVDVIYTSGDENGLQDDIFNGVMTGNYWATPGGLYISHGGYLLFPHANVVNRYVAAVPDISNIGYGLIGGTFNASKDFIPNKFSGKLGYVTAFSRVAPEGGGVRLGHEANFKLAYNLGPFMSVEWHGAYLWLGDFFDSPEINGEQGQRPVNPYQTFLAFRWLMF
ncbi:MAG: hypothetical protein AAGH79_08630 [Bacteroidota bacterium]